MASRRVDHPTGHDHSAANQVRRPENNTSARTTHSLSGSARRSLSRMYQNNLLAAIGYLDLANALDFPANVWNTDPLPLFAQVLMGLGGSVAILSSSFATWDLIRSLQNVKMLRTERAYLQQNRSEDMKLLALEKAWLGVNFRELGWEIIDRILLDSFMAIAGVMVGTGCLMAIRGDIPVVYLVSNILSGYLGNSFVATYAVINSIWSVYMWRRAHLNEAVVAKAKSGIHAEAFMLLHKHARKHKLYALVNGITILVSGVGSEVSSTLWPGYVVLIPCILGSVFCNYYWRYRIGYDRTSFQDRKFMKTCDLSDHLDLTISLRNAPHPWVTGPGLVVARSHSNANDAVRDFVHDLGHDFANALYEQGMKTASNEPASDKDAELSQSLDDAFSLVNELQFRYEERFISELFGYYLLEIQQSELEKEEKGCAP